MSDFLQQLDEDFKDDKDYQALSRDEKLRIVSTLEKMMEMGMAAIYGDEDTAEADADVPCGELVGQCQARCCTYIFALTKEEVNRGLIQYNKDKPFFIARDEDDGYCPHLDRSTLTCKVWHDRPLRCRRYDCRGDGDIWPEGVPG